MHHAPETARIGAKASREEIDDWLEGLEQHSVRFVTPFLANMLENSDPPPEVRALLEEALNPTAQFSATLLQIFLWGIISSIIGAATGPFLQGITNKLSQAAVWGASDDTTVPETSGSTTYRTSGLAGIARPLDPATIATAVGRGLNLGDPPTVDVPDWAYGEASQLGISAEEVNLQASIIGLPPALQELFEMYRRGIITLDQVKTGLREGDFRDDWIDYATQLVVAWLTPLDFVRAAVQEQMTYSDAREWAQKTGLDVSTDLPVETSGTEATPDMFGLAFAISGRPPGPEQLGRMALRGIIPWAGTGADATTFQQGIAESDVKTKWTPALQALETYVPPPRMVGTLFEHGAITEAQALTYWEDAGVPTELAQGFLYAAQQQHIGQDKLLAKGEITAGYYDRIFTNEQATELLGLLGFTGTVAADMLAIIDFRREISAINGVVHKVGTLYQAFKISAANATAALENVGVSAAQAASLMSTWETLRIAPVRVPSASEIGAAYKYQTITEDEGLAALAELGYQPRDAAIVLSSYAEAQVKPLPPAGTGVIG